MSSEHPKDSSASELAEEGVDQEKTGMAFYFVCAFFS